MVRSSRWRAYLSAWCTPQAIGNQIDRSFITRTVGVLALFDILKESILAEKILLNDVSGSTEILFKEIQGINFADDFFHASGAGRVRIKNIIKHISGLAQTSDPLILNAASRLIQHKLPLD